MFAAHGPIQDPGSFVPIALIIITSAIVFWRTLIKAVVIGLILLVVFGFVRTPTKPALTGS